MSYELDLNILLEENISKYFPEQGFRIEELKKIKENKEPDGEINSVTYKCSLKSQEDEKNLFIKRLGKGLWLEHKNEIIEMSRLNKHSSEIKTPKIFGVYPKINSLVIEEVGGIKSSLAFPLYSLPVLRNFYKKKMYSIVEKTASAIYNLQRLTKGKKVKLKTEYDFFESHDEFLKKIIDDFKKINDLREELKDKKMFTTRTFGDIKLGNIMVDGDNIKIIDFSFFKGFYFSDPTIFSINLELTQRIPYFNKKLFEELNNAFYEKYRNLATWEVDMDLIKKMEILSKIGTLIYFKKYLNKNKLPYKVSNFIDIRYLKSNINRNLSKV